jgi:hypothetical protein
LKEIVFRKTSSNNITADFEFLRIQNQSADGRIIAAFACSEKISQFFELFPSQLSGVFVKPAVKRITPEIQTSLFMFIKVSCLEGQNRISTHDDFHENHESN